MDVRTNFFIHCVIISCSRKTVYHAARSSLCAVHDCSVAVPEKQCPAYSASTADSVEESYCCGCTGQPMAL
jgi:hypothetical protein